MTLKERIATKVATWAIKSAGDRMTAEQLIVSVFGPTSTSMRYGSAQLLQAYNEMPWLRAIISRISWSTACVPWQLFVVTGESQKIAKKAGRTAKAIRRRDIARCQDPNQRLKIYKSLRREDSLREITSHPSLDLLDKGNPRFGGHVVRQVTQQHLDLVGEGAWVVERDGFGLPTDLWPIPPTWIAQTPWTMLNTGIGQQAEGNWIIHSNRGTLIVPKEDVIYFYHPNPADPYDRGTGIGHAIGDELETDEATARHLKKWFKNFAIPPFIISRKGGTGSGTDNTERLAEKWQAKLSGRNNTPFFSNQELNVNELSHTFNDMQLSQLRKDERDIFIHVYGMPPEIFGILENSNRSTIDAADYLMGKYVTVPRLEFMRGVLQQQLIERYDERLILDYVSPVLEDKEFELKVMQGAPANFSIDELRELANRRPLDGDVGKGFFVPMSSTYVRDLTEAAYEEPEPEPEPEPEVPPVPPVPPTDPEDEGVKPAEEDAEDEEDDAERTEEE
jgi:HK97 family phage portal protein